MAIRSRVPDIKRIGVGTLTKWSARDMDGLPLDLVSRLLPKKTWFKYSLLSHVHLHAKTQAHYANMAEDSSGGKKIQSRKISAFAFEALIKSIESCVVKMHWHLSDTEWGDYYSATNYEDSYFPDGKIL